MKPLNKGHLGYIKSVLCSEVVSYYYIQQGLMYISMGQNHRVCFGEVSFIRGFI